MMNSDHLLMDSTGVEIVPIVLLLLKASMWLSESLICLARYIINTLYKGFFSIILLAIVDSDYKFVWYDVIGEYDAIHVK